jgi:hypothetical protein
MGKGLGSIAIGLRVWGTAKALHVDANGDGLPMHDMHDEKVSSKYFPFFDILVFPIKYCRNLKLKSLFLVNNSPKGTIDEPGFLSENGISV